MSVCRYCTERTEDCHAKCEKYAEYVKERERIKEAKRKQSASESCNFGSSYFTGVKTNNDKMRRKR